MGSGKRAERSGAETAFNESIAGQAAEEAVRAKSNSKFSPAQRNREEGITGESGVRFTRGFILTVGMDFSFKTATLYRETRHTILADW